MKRMLTVLVALVVTATICAAELPSGYVQTEYIESTGAQYIDSGYTFDYTCRAELDFQMTNTKGQQYLFGASANALSVSTYINGSATSGGKFTYTCNNDANSNKPSSMVVDKKRHTLVIDSLNGKFTISGDTPVSMAMDSTRTKTSDFPLAIFSTRMATVSASTDDKGIRTDLTASMRLYSFKIYKNNELKCDFIPCVDTVNSVVGLYDLERGGFYPSEGSQPFSGTVVPLAIDAPAGTTVKQGGVSDVALTVSGKGTVWMTGNNTLQSVDMSGMAGTSVSVPGGTLLFGSDSDGQVSNVIRSGDLGVPAYSTLIFSNSVTSVAGQLKGNKSGRTIVKDGEITVNNVVTCNGSTAAVEWDDSPWLIFDGCTASLNKGLISCNNGKFGHIVVTNGAQVTVAGGKVDFPAGDIYLSGENSKLSGTYTQYAFVLGGLLRTRLFQSGGTFSVGSGAGNGIIGNKTEADVYLSGGVFQINNSIDIGGGTTGQGYVYQTGGTFQLGGDAYKTLTIGKAGKGYYEISGGTLSYNDKQKDLNIAEAGYTGELRILGGVVKARKLVGRGGNSTVIFNGGEWQPTEATITDSLTTLQMGSKGITISNTTKDQTLSQGIADWAAHTTGAIVPDRYLSAGALTVKKSGRTLTLSATNTYSCATEVAQGTLKTAMNDILPSTTVLRIKAGATLDLNGTTQHVTGLCGAGTVKNGTLVVSGYVMPGLGDEGGTLTFTGATVTSDGFAMYVKEDGTTTGDISGALTLTAKAKVTAVPPANIKNRQVSLSLGSGCTLTANGVESGLKGYIASIDGGKITLGKPGIVIFVE